jgi:hypothetical protein
MPGVRFWASRVARPIRGALRRIARACEVYTWVDRRAGYQEFPAEALNAGVVVMVGCWESSRYFCDDPAPVREAFQWRQPVGHSTALEALIKGGNSVCVHVRRGDRVAVDKWRNSFASLGADYYRAAMDRMRGLALAPQFVVFSDDPAAAKTIVPPAAGVLHASDYAAGGDLADFYLMRLCNHFITANSTYSWWAAWLGEHPEKRVIVPGTWFRDGRSPDDLVSEGWIQL